MPTATKKQKEVLNFVNSYINKHGISPTIEETAKRFRRAVGTIHEHLEELTEKGFIKRKNSVRGIEIIKNNNLISIPLVGTIAAGQPIDAIEATDQTITIPGNEINQFSKYYALKVAGESMIDEGIFDGDTVVIREQSYADNGQTVVAIIDDNQATLKKIYKEKDRIRLQPANQALLPLYRTEVEIRGVVVKIIRNFELGQEETRLLANIITGFPYTKNVRRISKSSSTSPAKPFLQWVGGKREMIEQYKHLIPNKFKTYHEPFLGGGAMFYYLCPQKAILNDNNKELITTYRGVKNFPEETIKYLNELKKHHSKALFEKIRNLDREMNIFNELNDAEIAARMIYLNQTCFNGLYRVNQKEQFNVPIGSSLNRLISDPNTIKKASATLQNVELSTSDFAEIVKSAEKDDFVYFDPPYYPISKNSDFTRYTKEKFYTEDQERLKNTIDNLTKQSIKVMLSNSDCHYINELYCNYNIHKVNSSRNLNCKKDKRGKVSELVITNY